MLPDGSVMPVATVGNFGQPATSHFSPHFTFDPEARHLDLCCNLYKQFAWTSLCFEAMVLFTLDYTHWSFWFLQFKHHRVSWHKTVRRFIKSNCFYQFGKCGRNFLLCKTKMLVEKEYESNLQKKSFCNASTNAFSFLWFLSAGKWWDLANAS